MSDFTRHKAYLLKSGVPYDRAVEMSADEAAKVARLFRQVELEAGMKRTLWLLAIISTLFVVIAVAAFLASGLAQ